MTCREAQRPRSMETFDTVEVTGLPGLKVMAVYNTTEGEFQFLTKLGKDAGLPEILQNNSDRTFDIAALLNATGVPNATVADKWSLVRLHFHFCLIYFDEC